VKIGSGPRHCNQHLLSGDVTVRQPVDGKASLFRCKPGNLPYILDNYFSAERIILIH